MNVWKEFLIGMLYPRHCPVCQKIVAEHGALICTSCYGKLTPIREPKCKKCGKPLEYEEKEYCRDCEKTTHFFTGGMALYPYEGKVKTSIYQIKFHNKREYLDFYSREMVRVFGKEILKFQPDGLIPVPLHRKKMRKRGFNQAELLARQIGAQLKLPVYPDAVVRIRDTKPQKELNRQERKQNLKHAFEVTKLEACIKKVLLVDDIYTTGTTMDEIAAILLAAGVKEVRILTLCIGKTDS